MLNSVGINFEALISNNYFLTNLKKFPILILDSKISTDIINSSAG